MKKLAIGFVIGLLLGATGTAIAARIIGGSGYLMGWTVTVEGEEACSDPYVWTSTQEIEC